jgi:hypothetical protein
MKIPALAVVFLPLNLAHALQVRAPVAINVTSVSLTGTGCPPNSFATASALAKFDYELPLMIWTLVTLRSDVTIIFDRFLQSPNSGTSNCSIALAGLFICFAPYTFN